MKKFSISTAIAGLLLFVNLASAGNIKSDALNGAWHTQEGSREETISFMDGYFVHSVYDKTNKQFLFTWGGPYEIRNAQVIVTVEFDTEQKDRVGQTTSLPYKLSGNQLSVTVNGQAKNWKQVDNGTGGLAGTWRISGRKQGDKMQPINPGPRKTLKILSGSRFQWVAINTDTKEFFGTGGGTYTFRDGKYTETIEFFSRDNSRVGASLSFDASVANKQWNHKGLSSKGDPIEEVWSRIQ